MNRNNWKLLLSLIGIFILILLVWFVPNFDNEKANNTIATIALLGLGWQVLLNQSSLVFMSWQRIKIYFKGDTVAWRGTYKFFIKDDYSFKENNHIFIDKLKEEGEVKIKNEQEGQGYYKFILEKDGYDKQININCDLGFEGYYQVKISASSSAAYKDSKLEFGKYLELVEKYVSPYSKINVKEPIKLKEIYSVVIEFRKYNPFYRIMVKHIEENKDTKLSFNLSFKEGNSRISIKNKSLEINSPEKKDIENILNKYIPISNIK